MNGEAYAFNLDLLMVVDYVGGGNDPVVTVVCGDISAAGISVGSDLNSSVDVDGISDCWDLRLGGEIRSGLATYAVVVGLKCRYWRRRGMRRVCGPWRRPGPASCRGVRRVVGEWSGGRFRSQQQVDLPLLVVDGPVGRSDVLVPVGDGFFEVVDGRDLVCDGVLVGGDDGVSVADGWSAADCCVACVARSARRNSRSWAMRVLRLAMAAIKSTCSSRAWAEMVARSDSTNCLAFSWLATTVWWLAVS